MFKELGAMMSLLGNKDKLAGEIAKMNEAVGKMTAEGTAGAGMVVVKVSGRMEVLSCRISDEAIKLNDKEMLEDLIVAATNTALGKARAMLAEQTAKMAQSMGISPEMLSGLGGGGLPGL